MLRAAGERAQLQVTARQVESGLVVVTNKLAHRRASKKERDRESNHKQTNKQTFVAFCRIATKD